MNMNLVTKVTESQLRKDIPTFKSGDTVKVYVKIKEGNKVTAELLSVTIYGILSAHFTLI